MRELLEKLKEVAEDATTVAREAYGARKSVESLWLRAGRVERMAWGIFWEVEKFDSSAKDGVEPNRPK